jgi:hypothetical protein
MIASKNRIVPIDELSVNVSKLHPRVHSLKGPVKGAQLNILIVILNRLLTVYV